MTWPIIKDCFSSLLPSNREELQSWAQSRSLPAGYVFRARLMLALGEGKTYREIEDSLGASAPTVSKCSHIHGFTVRMPQLIGMHEMSHRGRVIAATGEGGLDGFRTLHSDAFNEPHCASDQGSQDHQTSNGIGFDAATRWRKR